MLFFSKLPGVARAMADDYRDFLDEYRAGSAKMIEAAKRGYRLDPSLATHPPCLVPAMPG